MNVYITPEHYERAKENGVSYSALNSRVRVYDWDLELAITTPLRKSTRRAIREEIIDTAKANGISRDLLMHRIFELDWTPERAATTSKEDARKQRDTSRRTFTDAELAQIETLGMTPSGVRQRLRKGWTREIALTAAPVARGHRRWFKL